MSDVLLCRGGFRDDTAVVRLHKDAGLTIRTLEQDISSVNSSDLVSHGRQMPACVVFRASRGAQMVDEEIVRGLRRLRSECVDVAFLALMEAPRGYSDERSAAMAYLLNAGADDVMPEWQEPAELAVRVAAIVRRAQGQRDRAYLSKPTIDPRRRELVGPFGRSKLTAKEAVVMRELLNTDGVVARSVIGERLWTGDWQGTPKAIDMHISSLRRKLPVACGSAWRIETIRGAGFLLGSEEETDEMSLSRMAPLPY